MRYDTLKKEISWLSEGPFITEKEAFLDEIVRRHGILRVTDFGHPIDIGGGRWRPVRLPEPYIALITGNLRMSEYFRKRNAYGHGVYVAEYVEPFLNLLEEFSRFHVSNAVYCTGWKAGRETKLDVLTAALLSRSPEMVEWVVKHFADIPWGDELSRCIVKADKKTRMIICQYHPELPFFIPVGTIVHRCDVILLKAYLEECSRTGRDAQKDFLSMELPGLNNRRHWQYLAWEGRNAALFYRYAFSRFEKRELRKRFLRAMFIEENFPGKRSLIRLFQKYIDAEDDFADYLNVGQWDQITGSCIQGYESLCRIYEEWEIERLPVSLYGFSRKLCESASDGNIRRILDAFRPVGLQNRVDELTREILRRGSKKLLQKAILRGFMTAANRSALLAEADRLQCGKEIRVRLMGIPCGESLAERYRQGERLDN